MSGWKEAWCGVVLRYPEWSSLSEQTLFQPVEFQRLHTTDAQDAASSQCQATCSCRMSTAASNGRWDRLSIFYSPLQHREKPYLRSLLRCRNTGCTKATLGLRRAAVWLHNCDFYHRPWDNSGRLDDRPVHSRSPPLIPLGAKIRLCHFAENLGARAM